jgi:hypothetical protein
VAGIDAERGELILDADDRHVEAVLAVDRGRRADRVRAAVAGMQVQRRGSRPLAGRFGYDDGPLR